MVLPINQVNTNTISVCVELSTAASPPGKRYAATNSMAWKKPMFRKPSRATKPHSPRRGSLCVHASSNRPAGNTRMSAAVNGRFGGRNSVVTR